MTALRNKFCRRSNSPTATATRRPADPFLVRRTAAHLAGYRRAGAGRPVRRRPAVGPAAQRVCPLLAQPGRCRIRSAAINGQRPRRSHARHAGRATDRHERRRPCRDWSSYPTRTAVWSLAAPGNIPGARAGFDPASYTTRAGPAFPLSDPQVRLLDLDGDHRVDFLLGGSRLSWPSATAAADLPGWRRSRQVAMFLRSRSPTRGYRSPT